MKVLVYDTRISTVNDTYLHFDIYVDEANVQNINQYVLDYLANHNITAKEIFASKCAFCHSTIAYPDVEQAIEQSGHFIVMLESFPN